MTDETLAAKLKELGEKATQGPWVPDSECDGPLVGSIIHSDTWVSSPEGAVFDENGCCSSDDAALISELRTALPAIIAALEARPSPREGEMQAAGLELSRATNLFYSSMAVVLMNAPRNQVQQDAATRLGKALEVAREVFELPARAALQPQQHKEA